MKSITMDVQPSPPAVRHHIRGLLHADAPVSGIDILVHRRVSLEKWVLRSASNAFWRLYWPISRGGRLLLDGAEHQLEPGYLYLISPHTTFHSECLRPFSKWFLHFHVGGLPDACRPGIVRVRPNARIRALLSRVCPNPKRSLDSEHSPVLTLETLELVLLTLQQALPRFQLASQADARLPRCVGYLKDRMKAKVKLAELARFAGMSVRAISHLFVDELGFPPMRYQLELRLNHAMRLLRHTDHSIEVISEECGFPNRYYFTRMLSKYRKTTPAAFRAQMSRL